MKLQYGKEPEKFLNNGYDDNFEDTWQRRNIVKLLLLISVTGKSRKEQDKQNEN